MVVQYQSATSLEVSRKKHPAWCCPRLLSPSVLPGPLGRLLALFGVSGVGARVYFLGITGQPPDADVTPATNDPIEICASLFRDV